MDKIKTEQQANKLIDLNIFAEKWSAPFVARKSAREFSGGILNPRTLANADSRGEGPEGRIRIGNTIAYPVESLIRYMEKRMRPVENREPAGDNDKFMTPL